MSIATQQTQESTTKAADTADRLEGCRVWVRESLQWVTVASDDEGAVTDSLGRSFARSAVLAPPAVGDRVRVYCPNGEAVVGYWLGFEELPSTEGAMMLANIFIEASGSAERRHVNILNTERGVCRMPHNVTSVELVRELVRELASSADLVRSTQEASQARIDSIVEGLFEEAQERDWCSEFDDFMERMGLPARQREFELRVEVPVTVYVTVTANNYDDAVEDVDSVMVWDALTRSDLDMSSAEISEN